MEKRGKKFLLIKKGGKMRRGFTLLELLTVVIIIAILAAIAIPQFFRAAERARASEGVHVLGIIRSAQLRYYAEHGFFTDKIEHLDIDVPTATLKYFGTPTLNKSATYMGSGDEDLVSIKRNNVQCGSYCGYTLKIGDDTGKVICSKGGGATNQCPPGFDSSY